MFVLLHLVTALLPPPPQERYESSLGAIVARFSPPMSTFKLSVTLILQCIYPPYLSHCIFSWQMRVAVSSTSPYLTSSEGSPGVNQLSARASDPRLLGERTVIST